jgi:hypothetical protein
MVFLVKICRIFSILRKIKWGNKKVSKDFLKKNQVAKFTKFQSIAIFELLDFYIRFLEVTKI